MIGGVCVDVWLDGWLARKMGQITDFGKFMDALSDKIFTSGLFVALLALLDLEWALFPVLLILAREFLVTGLRLAAAAQGVVLAAEKAGKVIGHGGDKINSIQAESGASVKMN